MASIDGSDSLQALSPMPILYKSCSMAHTGKVPYVFVARESSTGTWTGGTAIMIAMPVHDAVSMRKQGKSIEAIQL